MNALPPRASIHPRYSRDSQAPWQVVSGMALSLLAAAPAFAGFSTINTNAAGEPGQEQIIQHVFGGSFQSDGQNFSNGTVTATRVDDSQDLVWPQINAIVSAQTVASFAQLQQSFGYFNGAVGGNFQTLFNVTGQGYDVSGQSGAVPMNDVYRLGRGGSDSLYSSNNADNPDGRDHMITYAITGEPGAKPNVQTWMLFWEDTPAPKSDFDYNDLVVEMKTDPPVAGGGPPVAVPLPRAAWMGLSGLLTLAVVGTLRSRFRHLALA